MAPQPLLFTLSGIDTAKLDKRFNIGMVSNIQTSSQPKNTTKLADLSKHAPTRFMSFLDNAKRERQCTVSMIDFTRHAPLQGGPYACYWCRHPIPKKVQPIGCPLEYKANVLVKTYYSEINKNTYTIKNQVTDLPSNTTDGIVSQPRDYYVTDGIFCSFNCCAAYAQDMKRHSDRHSRSSMLLRKMYCDTHPGCDRAVKIVPAPDWRLLKPYGGHLSLKDFRKSFNTLVYDSYGTTTTTSLQFQSIARLHEERLIL